MNSTRSWSAADTALCAMRMTVPSMFAVNERDNEGWRASRASSRKSSSSRSTRQRVRWHDRRNESSSGSASRLVRTSSAGSRRSLERLKRRIRDITQRVKGVSMKTTMEELAPYMRGWRNFFGFCETPEALVALTRWVRLRLRAALWRQWKTPCRRRAALIALRVFGQLCNTADSGRGPWYIARSKALSLGLSNAYFRSLGLPSLFGAC